MNKQEINQALKLHYGQFATYINELSEEKFSYRKESKWTAAEQISHMIVCTIPLLKIFGKEKSVIEKLFGKTNNPPRSYNEMLAMYQGKLKDGGKAPQPFNPPENLNETKEVLSKQLIDLINQLTNCIDTFSVEELDTLLITHPLLGNISLREMLYNAIYHVQHHHEQSILNLPTN